MKNKRKKVFIIGPGSMGREYYKCFKDLNSEIHILGRSKKSFSKFKNVSDISTYTDIKEFNSKQDAKSFDLCVICVSVEALSENAISAMNMGFKKVLVEKPGSLNKNDLMNLHSISKKKQCKIFIAYNRRYYSSVTKAMELIKKDGGALSCFFDFTEWEKTVLESGINDAVIKNWFFANSTHVIDTVFFLIGRPEKIRFFGRRELEWHEGNSLYVGAGISERNVPFSFHSNWNSSGRWNIEIMTKEIKIILCPTEDLKIVRKNSIKIEEFKREKVDIDFKPGLYNQVKDILLDVPKYSCSLDEHIKNWQIYEELFTKRIL